MEDEVVRVVRIAAEAARGQGEDPDAYDVGVERSDEGFVVRFLSRGRVRGGGFEMLVDEARGEVVRTLRYQ